MKRGKIMKSKASILTAVFILCASLFASSALAQAPAMDDSMFKEAYKAMLMSAGKKPGDVLTVAECSSLAPDKSVADMCKAYDANGDGKITEAEYMAKEKSLFK
jgi:hypothetical protein